MANIAILDCGYLTASSVTGTQAPSLANLGTAMNLKIVDISMEGGANIDVDEIINTNSGPAIGFNSISAAKIVLNGVLDRNDSTDMSYLDELMDLRKTYGVKLLYYTDTTDGYRDVTDTLGDRNKNDVHKSNNFSGTAVPHLHVRVTSFRVTQSAPTHLRYVLECVETE